MDRKQLENSAPQLSHNKIKFSEQFPKCPGWRDHSITGPVKRLDPDFFGRIGKTADALIRAELPHERIVDYV